MASVPDLYNTIFQLKHELRVAELMALAPRLAGSELLLHELMYALGQLPLPCYSQVRAFLLGYIADETQAPVVRHEATEALANYQEPSDLPVFEQYLDSKVEALRDTCQLAVEKLRRCELKGLYGKQFYQTKQPAAPFSQAEASAALGGRSLEEYLLDKQVPMFNRYRMMYFCRDVRTAASIRALASVLKPEHWGATTALMRHQVCFIFGQTAEMTHLADAEIRQAIANEAEDEIVRHEALNALGSYSSERGLSESLKGAASQIVRQTAEVTLSQMAYWNEQ